MLVTRPVSVFADVDENGYLGSAEWLYNKDAADVLTLVERVQHDDEARKNLEFWVERHFGDTSPGVTTRRFHEAVETLIAQWEKHAALHVEDRKTAESDPFANEDDD